MISATNILIVKKNLNVNGEDLPFTSQVLFFQFLKQILSILLCKCEFFKFVEHVDQTNVIKVKLFLVQNVTHESICQHIVSLSELSVEEVCSQLA